MAIESEIKFTVSGPGVFDRIAALREIASFEARDMGIHRHRDTYYDTDDLLLLRSKIVLRLRESATGAVLTFKAQAPGGKGYFRRVEIEAPVSLSAGEIKTGRFPDCPPVQELRKHTGAVLLRPSLEIVNDRRIIRLCLSGIPRFEMALDDVTFSGPRGKARVHELEVESLGWEDEALTGIGAWLGERFPLKGAGPSKYILGMELVGKEL